jgi:hypothetical protein
MLHRVILGTVGFYVIFAVGWDAAMDLLGIPHESFCDACAWWNVYTKGLFAVLLPGLWIHVFVLPIIGWWQK